MLRSAALLALLALLSKGLGLARDALVAHHFGTGDATQAFVIASTVPMQVLNIFLGGAIIDAFLPAYYQRLQGEDGPRRAGRYFGGIFLLLTLTGTGVAALFAATAPWVVETLGPGLSLAAQQRATEMARLLAWTIPVLVASTVIAALLNAHERFTAPGLRTPSNNLAFIGAVALLAGVLGDGALMAAFALGALAQLGVQTPGLVSARRGLGFSAGLDRTDIRELLSRYLPVLATHAMLQSIVLLDRPFSTLASEGGAASYAYAERFVELSRGVLGSSLAVVIFPRLAKAIASHDDREGLPEQVQDLMGRALGLVAFLTLPLGILLGGFGAPIVALLFQRGQFDAAATAQTASGLLGLALTPLSYGMIYVLDRLLVARGRLWAWAACMAMGLGANALFKMVWVDDLGLLGVGLGTALGTALTALGGLALARLSRRTLAHVGRDLLGGALPFGAAFILVRLAATVGGQPWAFGLGGAVVFVVVGSLIALAKPAPALRQLLEVVGRRWRGPKT